MKLSLIFLSIKSIPKTDWSSDTPLNFKPKLKTFLLLCIGLSFFGFGESLLIHSTIGVSPWTVLAEGLSIKLNWSVGFATFIVSVLVLSSWILLKQKPGIGTLLNIIIIAGMIDISLFFSIFQQIFFFGKCPNWNFRSFICWNWERNLSDCKFRSWSKRRPYDWFTTCHKFPNCLG